MSGRIVLEGNAESRACCPNPLLGKQNLEPDSALVRRRGEDTAPTFWFTVPIPLCRAQQGFEVSLRRLL